MDGKGKLGLILMGGKPVKDGAEEEHEEYGSAGKKLASKEILAAIKSGDQEALSDALSAFIECCGY